MKKQKIESTVSELSTLEEELLRIENQINIENNRIISTPWFQKEYYQVCKMFEKRGYPPPSEEEFIEVLSDISEEGSGQ